MLNCGDSALFLSWYLPTLLVVAVRDSYGLCSVLAGMLTKI